MPISPMPVPVKGQLMKYPLELAQVIILALTPTVSLLEALGGRAAFRLRAGPFHLTLTETEVLLRSGEYRRGWCVSISEDRSPELMRIRWNDLVIDVVQFRPNDWLSRFVGTLSPSATQVHRHGLPFAEENLRHELNMRRRRSVAVREREREIGRQSHSHNG
jgi:hypothetical protein